MEAGRAWRQTSCDVAYWYVCLAVFGLQRYRVFCVCLTDISLDQMHVSVGHQLRNAMRCS